MSSKLNPSEELLTKWSEYYTTDINYLKDTQELIKSYTPINMTPLERRLKINNTLDILQELESETGFYEKYKGYCFLYSGKNNRFQRSGGW